jgi:carbohydrate diacid regulator
LVEQELGVLRSAADWPQLRATVVNWCESGFNQVAAAKALNIHRNTLLYRLDKIERLVGRSWRDHRAMLSLYIACLADQLGPPE